MPRPSCGAPCATHDPTSAGRFELEAAIQSAHAQRRRGTPVDRQAIALLQDRLATVAPSLGARIARAAAIARVAGPHRGLALIDEAIADAGEHAAGFQPAHAARAHLLAEAGEPSRAIVAYRRAIDLTTHTPTARYLRRRLAALEEVSASSAV